MTSDERIAWAIRDSQVVLAPIPATRPPNPEQINELFDIIDDYQLLEAREDIEGSAVQSPTIVPDMVTADNEDVASGACK